MIKPSLIQVLERVLKISRAVLRRGGAAGFVAPQSKIHEGYSPSSLLAIRPAAPAISSPSYFQNTLLGLLGLACLTGCTTVTVYQAPVIKFQTAVTSANSGIGAYLSGVNTIIAEGNIYDEVGLDKDWSAADLANLIPQEQIQLRLQALSTISSYANALGAIVDSKDVANLGQAAKSFGDSITNVSNTFSSLNGKPTTLDIGAPVTALVTLCGTMAIEKMQKDAIEKGIIDGAANIETIIDKLKTDPIWNAIAAVSDTSESAIWRGKMKIYNDLRKKTDPKDLNNLITQFVADYNSIQTLRSLQVGSLLSDMENAHVALVTFAKSGKSPKDLSDLSGQIDVLTSHVQLFSNAIASVQSAVKSSK